MIQIIENIVWWVALIFGIWFMISKKKNISAEQPSLEPLNGKEKLFVFVLCLVNPVLIGAILYYGWRKKIPHKAKQSNKISWLALLIDVALLIIIVVIVPQYKNSHTTIGTVTSSAIPAWQTYTNTQMHFSMDYPTNWKIDETLATYSLMPSVAFKEDLYSSTDYFLVSISPNAQFSDLDHSDTPYTKIIFAGQDALQQIKGNKITIHFQFNNDLYTVLSERYDLPEAKKALQSFKLIK